MKTKSVAVVSTTKEIRTICGCSKPGTLFFISKLSKPMAKEILLHRSKNRSITSCTAKKTIVDMARDMNNGCFTPLDPLRFLQGGDACDMQHRLIAFLGSNLVCLDDVPCQVVDMAMLKRIDVNVRKRSLGDLAEITGEETIPPKVVSVVRLDMYGWSGSGPGKLTMVDFVKEHAMLGVATEVVQMSPKSPAGLLAAVVRASYIDKDMAFSLFKRVHCGGEPSDEKELAYLREYNRARALVGSSGGSTALIFAKKFMLLFAKKIGYRVRASVDGAGEMSAMPGFAESKAEAKRVISNDSSYVAAVGGVCPVIRSLDNRRLGRDTQNQ